MSTREAVAPSPLLAPPLLTDEDMARSHDRARVHHARRHRKRWYLLWLLVGPGNPRDARRERRAEHDRLRLRRGAVRPRVLRAVHPDPVRDGLRLPGDVHARRRRHPPRLRRAGAAALRARLGLVRRGRPDVHEPRDARRRVRLDPRRARLLPPRRGGGRRPRARARGVHPQRRTLLALGADRARHGAVQRPVPGGGDPRQTARRNARELLRLHPLPVGRLQHAAAAARLDDRRDGHAVDDLLPAERVRRQGHDPQRRQATGATTRPPAPSWLRSSGSARWSSAQRCWRTADRASRGSPAPASPRRSSTSPAAPPAPCSRWG